MTPEPLPPSGESLKRIADSLEMIGLFLQVLAEGYTEALPTASVVETQSGPVELH